MRKHLGSNGTLVERWFAVLAAAFSIFLCACGPSVPPSGGGDGGFSGPVLDLGGKPGEIVSISRVFAMPDGSFGVLAGFSGAGENRVRFVRFDENMREIPGAGFETSLPAGEMFHLARSAAIGPAGAVAFCYAVHPQSGARLHLGVASPGGGFRSVFLGKWGWSEDLDSGAPGVFGGNAVLSDVKIAAYGGGFALLARTKSYGKIPSEVRKLLDGPKAVLVYPETRLAAALFDSSCSLLKKLDLGRITYEVSYDISRLGDGFGVLTYVFDSHEPKADRAGVYDSGWAECGYSRKMKMKVFEAAESFSKEVFTGLRRISDSFDGLREFPVGCGQKPYFIEGDADGVVLLSTARPEGAEWGVASEEINVFSAGDFKKPHFSGSVKFTEPVDEIPVVFDTSFSKLGGNFVQIVLRWEGAENRAAAVSFGEGGASVREASIAGDWRPVNFARGRVFFVRGGFRENAFIASLPVAE